MTAGCIEEVARLPIARVREGVVHGNSVDMEHEIGLRVPQQAETVADRGGTRIGRTRYAPLPTPQEPKVWPKILGLCILES